MEWISALEGAVSKIVKLVAGVDEEAEVAAAKPKSWAEQLERTYASVGEPRGWARFHARWARPEPLAFCGAVARAEPAQKIVVNLTCC